MLCERLTRLLSCMSLQVQGAGAHFRARRGCCCSSCVLAVWCFGILLQQAHGRQGILSSSEHLAVSKKLHPHLMQPWCRVDSKQLQLAAVTCSC
jgi:hypothetical protein